MKMVQMAGLAVVAAALAAAQTMPTYRVEFTMHDAGEQAAKAVRHYILVATPDVRTSLKLGSRDPVESSSGQYSYIDTGVNISCTLHEAAEQKVQLTGNLELSGIVPRDKAAPTNSANPTIGQLSLTMSGIMTPGKAATMGSIDDPVTGRRFDVEVTLTRVGI